MITTAIIQPRLRRRKFKLNYKGSIEHICHNAGIDIEHLRTRTRKAEYAQKRQAIMAFNHLCLYKTFADSGKIFMKDHATALYSAQKVTDEIHLSKKYPNIEKSLRLRTFELLLMQTNVKRF